MSTTALLAFTTAALLLTITPGLDTMMLLRMVLGGGRRTGLVGGFGTTLGCLVWGAASIAGLTALLMASQLAYDVVRYAGAVYLLWLGGSALWKSWRGAQAEKPTEAPTTTPVQALRIGFTTNVLNPKIGVFYLSLLPQFLPTSGESTGWAALLVGIHVGIGQVWQIVVVWLAGRAAVVLTRPRVRRWTERLTASVLVGFGLKVAFDSGARG
ncbi:threonine/homoserine/homoserine lactone efflux protein [Saccharothrix tamanrassetensis]|uniref:Threonine/homoserine/homoserine lactone efflux protein n=1 Tax=Saccharothrix tamanrassetensis TaxID=1051531 RepID=A0A841CHU3_9PSEU|nr:LysE family translocator [Saccharothrix tamanrassetensis]MBB5955697.1 threonine/homoserine/homoserine lactone efflux protein [Saccharothrix tamanrassetensis]